MDVDFTNHIITSVSIGGYELLFTETMRNTLFVSISLIAFALWVNITVNGYANIPNGLQNAIELVVETFAITAEDSLGVANTRCGGWFFSVFFFVLLSNYSGLLGLRPPTASLSTTLSLALATFGLIHITGIKNQKLGYFKGYFEPFPVFFPMNVLSALSVPVSLSFRLFGNILGGTIIMGMLHQALPNVLRIFVPIPFHLYFDIFSGAVQAVIFTLLGLMLIGERLE